MQPIPVGAQGSFALLVEPEHLANRFKDAMLPPVLATPVMIMIMENAALNAIRPYLDPGESAVGTAVDIRHLAAMPVARRGGQQRADERRRIRAAIRPDQSARRIAAAALVGVSPRAPRASSSAASAPISANAPAAKNAESKLPVAATR
jgi:predicted thioesterase